MPARSRMPRSSDSIQKIGTWPLPRTAYATMMDKLRAFGVKVVAFDVFYPEPAPSCGENQPDKVFAKSIQDFVANPASKVSVKLARRPAIAASGWHRAAATPEPAPGQVG